MANNYENVPVFRTGVPADNPEAIIGVASVKTDEETGEVITTIRSTGSFFSDFLDLGHLMAFELNGSIHCVDPEKAKKWRSRP